MTASSSVVIGEYLEVDPPNRVVFTWGFEGTEPFVEPGSTRVEVTLERDGAPYFRAGEPLPR